MDEAQIITPGSGQAPEYSPPPPPARTLLVAGVRLTSRGGIVDCECPVSVVLQDQVLIRFPEGMRVGRILRLPRQVKGSKKQYPKLIRPVSSDDRAKIRQQGESAHEMLMKARQMARELNLDMQFGEAEQYFDGSRIVLYFAAENRVDFREMLQRLHKIAHRRVELRQEGLRDIAGMVGGVGTCGQELCCSRWLSSFDPVSIRAAKTQCLSITSEKVTGQCGRLKCCLNYENSMYKELRADMPEPGKWIKSASGYAKVREINVFSREITAVPLIRGDDYFVTIQRRDVEEIYKKPPEDLLRQLNSRNPRRKSDSEGESEQNPEGSSRNRAEGQKETPRKKPGQQEQRAADDNQTNEAKPRSNRRRRRRRNRKPNTE